MNGSAIGRCGWAWSRLREQVLKEEPWCRRCGRPSREVDHIIPRRLGGSDDRANLMGFCKRCHERKTGAEKRRMRGRKGCDVMGNPLDPRHPWNKQKAKGGATFHRF